MANELRAIEYEYSLGDTYVLIFGDLQFTIVRDEAIVQHQDELDYAEALLFGSEDDKLSYGGTFTTETTYSLEMAFMDFQSVTSELVIGNTGLVVGTDGGVILRTSGTGGDDHSIGASLVEGEDYVIGWEISGTTLRDVTVNITNNEVTDSTVITLPVDEDMTFIDEELPVYYSGIGLRLGEAVYYAGGSAIGTLVPQLTGGMKNTDTGTYIYNRGSAANSFPLEVLLDQKVNPNAGTGAVAIASPFDSEDLFEVRFVQREDVMYFTHPDYGEYRLTRYNHYQWEFEVSGYVPNVSSPVGLTASYDGTGTFEIEYKVSATDVDGNESLPSEAVLITGDSASSWESGKYVDLAWTEVPEADIYTVYKSSRGYFGSIGSTASLTYSDDNIDPDAADGPLVERDPFAEEGDKPGALGIYQQRKVYGRTNNSPQTTWLTVTGSMDNLSVHRPLKDDSAITAQLDSNQVNNILHFISMKDLLIVTDNGLWTLSAGANSDALTPTSARYERHSAVGGSRIPPIVSGNTVLVVPTYRRGVQEMFYSLQADGYEGSPLELLAGHLFEDDSIVDWCYQRDQSIIWCVMESGKLCTLTYLREHEVVAWTTQETDGLFKTAACVRVGDRDVPHFIVYRNGLYNVETMAERGTDLASDAVYLDSSLIYSGDPATVFSGFDHLEGMSISILADGVLVEDVVISGGGFTLDTAASVVIAGLPYVSDFETLGLNYEDQGGTGFGGKKAISSVILSVEKSISAKVGHAEDTLVEKKFYGGTLFTGKCPVQIQPNWDRDGKVHVQNDKPYPLTILAHIAEFISGEN